jgi:predicted nucleic acid-binding protein
MSVEVFLDTNVFIYQLEYEDQRKADIAEGLISRGIASGTACISFQVIQECLNTVLRMAETPLDSEEARKYVDEVLDPLWTVMPSRELYFRGLDIRKRYGFGFHDSLILSAALEAGCRKLYTEDLQHGQRVEHLVVENPFLE